MFQPGFVLDAWCDGMHSAICIGHVPRTKVTVKSGEATGRCCQIHLGFIVHFVLLSIQKPLTVANIL